MRVPAGQCSRTGVGSGRPATLSKASPCAPFSRHQERRCSRARVVVTRAGTSFEDTPLFADSSLFGKPSDPKRGAEKKQANIDDVELVSEAGMDYTELRDALKAGNFREADDVTRRLLIELAGEEAVKRNWVYFSEVRGIAAADLRTVDELWKTASGGKFGYSVQRQLWLQNNKRWQPFFKKIDWTVGENSAYRKWPAEFIYSIDAAKGHLPLTNALRGTELFNELLTHPAWDVPEEKKAGSDFSSTDTKFSF